MMRKMRKRRKMTRKSSWGGEFHLGSISNYFSVIGAKHTMASKDTQLFRATHGVVRYVDSDSGVELLRRVAPLAAGMTLEKMPDFGEIGVDDPHCEAFLAVYSCREDPRLTYLSQYRAPDASDEASNVYEALDGAGFASSADAVEVLDKALAKDPQLFAAGSAGWNRKKAQDYIDACRMSKRLDEPRLVRMVGGKVSADLPIGKPSASPSPVKTPRKTKTKAPRKTSPAPSLSDAELARLTAGVDYRRYF